MKRGCSNGSALMGAADAHSLSSAFVRWTRHALTRLAYPRRHSRRQRRRNLRSQDDILPSCLMDEWICTQVLASRRPLHLDDRVDGCCLLSHPLHHCFISLSLSLSLSRRLESHDASSPSSLKPAPTRITRQAIGVSTYSSS